MVNTLDSPYNDPGLIPGSGGAVGIWMYYPVVVPSLPRGTLNRGAVCVRMHLSSCTDIKEPG